MNRRKLDLVYRRESQQLVLKEKGFTVLYLWNVTEIIKGKGSDEGNVRIFLEDKLIGDIWDVDKIEEL